MVLLRVLNRSAFICNVCFLLAIGILWTKRPVPDGLTSLIIVMGFVLSVILNLAIMIWLLVLRINKKSMTGVPRPLVYLNAMFFIIQAILILKSFK